MVDRKDDRELFSKTDMKNVAAYYGFDLTEPNISQESKPHQILEGTLEAKCPHCGKMSEHLLRAKCPHCGFIF